MTHRHRWSVWKTYTKTLDRRSCACRARQTRFTEAEINRRLMKWHHSKSKLTVHRFIGISFNEYAKWVECRWNT